MDDINQETFIRLVSLIRDDQELHAFFQKVGDQGELERNLLLSRMLEEMKEKKAPPDHLEAIKLLRKKEVFMRLKSNFLYKGVN